MRSEILSQSDIDSLLGGGGTAALDLEKVAGTSPRDRAVELYDFRRPHRVSKERLRTLEAMYERLVKSLEGWMLSRVRGQIELNLHGVEQLSFGDYTLSLSTPCSAYLVDIHDSGGQQGVVEFGKEIAFFLVDRLLGGRGKPIYPGRALSPIERMVVRTVAERITQGVREIWDDYLKLDLAVAGFESVPEILRATSSDSPVLVGSIEVTAAGKTSLISVCLPFAVLDTFFADTTSNHRLGVTGSEGERKKNRAIVEGSLRGASLDVSARLPEFRISMKNLTSLQVGSILTTGIGKDSDIEISISGRKRFHGAAARVGKKLAVRVTEPVEYLPEGGVESDVVDESHSGEDQ